MIKQQTFVQLRQSVQQHQDAMNPTRTIAVTLASLPHITLRTVAKKGGYMARVTIETRELYSTRKIAYAVAERCASKA